VADTPVEPDQKSPKRGYGFVATVIAFFGVLQLYNIVAHHQTLLDLSESVKLLAAWWRYWLGELFGFLHINVPPLERELLSLLLLAGSAANIAFYRKHGSLLFSRLFRETFNQNANFNEIFGFKDRNLRVLFQFAFTSIALIGMIIAIIVKLPLWVGLYCLLSLVAMVIGLRSSDSDDSVLLLIGFFLAFPLMFTIMWITMTASYFREIFRACRYLLLLLVADLACRYIIDPLIPWISSLPTPPAV
jgi:hypothetical protein